jgi:transposase
MSTSLLYHRFGIVGYHYVHQKFEAGMTFFRIEQPRERLRCSACGSDNVWAQGAIERCFRGLPIGNQPTLIELKVPRVHCFDCDKVRQVKIPFADPKKHYTRSFERYALELSQHMTIKDVADHLMVSWNTIKEIQAKYLTRRFGKPKLHKLKQIAIDEINIGKGHRYLTVVLNLLTGAVVFVGDGKGVDALKPFWKRLRRSHAKIEAVATDMSKAYIRAIRDNIPRAVHVFDHFHVIKLYNEKLSAYYMKEDLRQIWLCQDKFQARLFLEDWLARARASEIRMLQSFADTLEEHHEGILNYYDYQISTGPLEGTNNKIQLMKRQAYGFRDHQFFKLKILGLHETKYALVG